MIPKEILKKVRKIEIYTKRLVTEVFSGGYKSIFKGRGIEFSEVRQYYPGDDVRNIDWNVTARTGQPFIKKFEEERELTIMFLLDVSGSTNFGSQSKLKKELAAEFVALLSFSAIKNNDNVGIVFFSDTVEKYVPAAKARSHILRLISEALYFKPKGKKTNMVEALNFVNSVIKKKAVIFLISDFQMEFNFEHLLKLTEKRHDVINVMISDPAEFEIKGWGFYRLFDPETGESRMVFANSKRFKEKLKSRREEKFRTCEQKFISCGTDFIRISTDMDIVKPVLEFFEKRKRRLH